MISGASVFQMIPADIVVSISKVFTYSWEIQTVTSSLRLFCQSFSIWLKMKAHALSISSLQEVDFVQGPLT